MIKPGQRFGHLLTLKQTENRVRCYCDCGFILDVPVSQLLSGKKTDCGCGNGLPPPNLIGNRYGRLVVKEWSYQKQSYLCQCDCGKELVLPLRTLLEENPRSCGCLSSTNPILGQQFGSLTPVESNGLQYKCLCSCGKEVWVSFDDLFWGTVTSCGCKPVRHFSEDLTGRTFGQLTVIREVSPYLINGEPKERRWLTKCSCGRESIMLHDNLLQGKSKTCGCGSGSLSVSAKKLPSLVGQTFSSLTVVEEVAPARSRKGHIARRFLCECECGNLTVCKQHDLRRKHSTSCGCQIKSTNPHTAIDLTGRRFGKLTVISEADSRISPCGKRTRIWNVVCECGTKRTFDQGTLLYNKPLSCGCDRLINPIGKKYGYLTVIKELEPLKTGRRRRQVLCNCECGNTIIAPLEYLTNGHKTSCGCKNRRDLTGRVFGDLTVLEETETRIGKTGKKYRQWECICSCGKLIIADQYKLTYGMKTHCGCKAKQLMDLTGQRFGRNTVLREIESSAGRKRRRWLIRCDCGTIRSVFQDTLVSGGSKSCGCTRQSRSRPSTLAGNNKHQLILPFAPESE